MQRLCSTHLNFSTTSAPWHDPPPPRRYPQCLFFLELLQSKEFREAIGKPEIKVGGLGQGLLLLGEPVMPAVQDDACQPCGASLLATCSCRAVPRVVLAGSAGLSINLAPLPHAS